jgi:hypothetical protein
MRVNRGQEMVIGGYVPAPKNFDSIVVGYYEGKQLFYVARVRNGFTPASRETLFKRFRGLDSQSCPFQNLLESGKGRWGEGLTAEDMNDDLHCQTIDLPKGEHAMRRRLISCLHQRRLLAPWLTGNLSAPHASHRVT